MHIALANGSAIGLLSGVPTLFGGYAQIRLRTLYMMSFWPWTVHIISVTEPSSFATHMRGLPLVAR